MPTKKKTTKKRVNKNLRKLNPRDHLKYKICISGAAETGLCSKDAIEKAEQVGREVAQMGMVLVTGATIGIPYWAAKGAKEAGGIVIGLSPAASKISHVKTYKLPTDYHDLIVYTGFEYAGRNLLLTKSADAVITICGRVGTLNEFTIAFEEHKPCGVLTGTGGAADMLKDILTKAKRGYGKTVFDSNVSSLLKKVVKLIDEKEASVNSKDRYNENYSATRDQA